MAKQAVNYQELNAELANILVTLQQDELDIDVAMAAYERGLVVTKQLETYLQQAENKITKLKSQTV